MATEYLFIHKESKVGQLPPLEVTLYKIPLFLLLQKVFSQILLQKSLNLQEENLQNVKSFAKTTYRIGKYGYQNHLTSRSGKSLSDIQNRINTDLNNTGKTSYRLNRYNTSNRSTTQKLKSSNRLHVNRFDKRSNIQNFSSVQHTIQSDLRQTGKYIYQLNVYGTDRVTNSIVPRPILGYLPGKPSRTRVVRSANALRSRNLKGKIYYTTRNSEVSKKKKTLDYIKKFAKESLKEGTSANDGTLTGDSIDKIKNLSLTAGNKAVNLVLQKKYLDSRKANFAKNSRYTLERSNNKLQTSKNYQRSKEGIFSKKLSRKKSIQKSYQITNFREKIKISNLKETIREIPLRLAKGFKKFVANATSSSGLMKFLIPLVLIFTLIGAFSLFFISTSSMSEYSYFFDSKDGTEIEKRFTSKELDYLKMITDEADKVKDDPNAEIIYDPVGHDPHEILALFNVLLLPRYLASKDNNFKMPWEELDKIIDQLIETRYKFNKEVWNDTYKDEKGNTVSVKHTRLTSKTTSVSNIVAIQGFDVPKSQAEFIERISGDASEMANKNGIYASIMIAQAILESDNGKSGLSREPYFNLFGIKGAYEGESVNMGTLEDTGGGNMVGINDNFRDYPSYKESMQDYADLIARQYPGAVKANTSSYRDAAYALQGTYATDTSYASKLISIIEANNLTRFDTYDSGIAKETKEKKKDLEDHQQKENKKKKEMKGDIFALTDYERDLYQKMFKAKGIMGTYNFPVKDYDWQKNIKESYGYYWDQENKEKVASDGTLIKIPAGKTVNSIVLGKVREVDGNRLVIESKDFTVVEYDNLDAISVQVGQTVNIGDAVAKTSGQGLYIRMFDGKKNPIDPKIVMFYEGKINPNNNAVNNATGTAILDTYDSIPGGSFPPPDPNFVAGNNTAVAGQCTWYVINRLTQLGVHVPQPMGNGGEWWIYGQKYGLPVSRTAKAGTAISFPPGVAWSDATYGHVAFVEKVGDNGEIYISEMNVKGPFVISYRTLPADVAAQCYYIDFGL
ncbi:glucosaminidase domain-containing protein [Aerococcus urinae]|uniref:glucosaminidase domain-containing protein n=1 Tax=Aerococcus urinae TaxID=1376 RepID=UPI0021587FFC|nr:glucosaminidase domain-containing protein [Aerococcus urinae]